MKKAIVFILLLICTTALFSCEKTDAPASDTAIIDVTPQMTVTPAPTPEPTPVPTPTPTPTPEPTPTPVPTATPFPVYTKKYADYVEKYTVTYLDYVEKNRKAPDHVTELPEPRFVRYEDGWYRNGEDTGEATLMFAGDLMCLSVQQSMAKHKYGVYNFNDFFSCVKPVFETADLVIGNLETTLCSRAPYKSEQTSINNMPNCNAPATFANAVRWAGFDGVVTNNNHSCDTGVYGILETIDNVNDYGLMHTGTFAEKDEKRYLLIDVNGIKVAILTYSNGYNGKERTITKEGRDLLLNTYYESWVIRDVENARADGAEYIIGFNHTGTEYTNTENANQLKFCQQMADAGIDYVINSHPHALQRYDILTTKDGRKVPVCYSMGNFISSMDNEISKDSMILTVTLTKDGDKIMMKDSYIPCRIMTYDGMQYVTVPVLPEYVNNATRSTLKSAYKRIKGVIGDKIECVGSME